MVQSIVQEKMGVRKNTEAGTRLHQDVRMMEISISRDDHTTKKMKIDMKEAQRRKKQKLLRKSMVVTRHEQRDTD